MIKKTNFPHDATIRRKCAKEIIQGKEELSLKEIESLSPDEIRHLFYKLYTYQIKLEMQNDKLLQAQSELEISRTHYFDLYDLAPVGYCSISEQGLIFEANQTAATMLGVARNSLLKQQINRFIHKEDQNLYYLHCKKLIDSSRPQSDELRMVNNTGVFFWVNLTSTLSKDSSGTPIFRIAISDIAGGRRTEEKLKRNEVDFSKLFEYNVEVMLIIDPETGNIINANKAAMDFYGWSAEKFKQMRIQEINTLPPEDVKREMKRTRSSGSLLLEFSHQRADSSIRHVEVSSSKIEIKGKDFLWSIIHDITEHKLMETELAKHRDHLETLVEQRTVNLQHEIKERKNSEKALRENETLLHTLIDTIPYLVWLKDLDGVYLSCNSNFGRFLGAKKSDIINKTDYDFVDKKLADFFREKDKAAMAADIPTTNEEEVIYNDDGHKELLETIKTPMYCNNGRLIGVLGIARDITKRKKAEQEHLAHLRFFECMDQMNRAIQVADDHEQMVENVLDTMLSIFDCDRAWMLYPCDPEAASINVLAERTRSEHPGALAMGLSIPMNTDFAECIRTTLASSDPVQFKAGLKHSLPLEMIDRFAIQSQLMTALYPKINKPWMLGLHQCSHPRIWTKEEMQLFKEICRRLSDGLTSLLMLRNLKKNEEKYRVLIQKIQIAVIVHKFDARILACNPAAEELLGLKEYQLIGKTLSEINWNLYREDGTVMAVEEYPGNQALAKAQALNNIVVGVQHPDKDKGVDRWALVNAEPVMGEDGCIVQAIVTFNDITEYKRAAKALEKSEAKMSGILDNISIGVILISPEMKILELNRQMREWFPGIDPAQHPVCYHVFNGPHNEDMCDDCPVHKTLQDGQVHKTTTLPPHMDGRRNYRIVSSPVRNAAGEITAVIEMVEDITETISLEARLHQAQKLKSIGTLAGGIAHDFNNILSAVFGYTELALEEVSENSRLFSYIQEIMQAGKRAKELINQILTFSRKGDLNLKPLRIDLVLKEALKLLRSSIPSTIEFKTNIDPACGLVLADSTQIHQVLMNLCTNAYNVMKKTGGVLTVSLKPVNRSFMDDMTNKTLIRNPFLELMVRDTGSGILNENLGKIFDPYFTTGEKGEGTGLGLAVVHGIVKSFNGDIIVDSEPGKGTTFRIYLPTVKQKQMVDHTKKPLPLAGGNERILFVDDDTVLVSVSQHMLQSLGYQTMTLTSSLRTLEVFENAPDNFDVLITDLTMPEMTGKELSKQILKIRPDMPIILCTGNSEMMNSKRCEESGIRGYLQKPILKRDLAEMIRKVLDENKK